MDVKNISEHRFWKTIDILLKNFSSVNKKVYSLKTLKYYQTKKKIVTSEKFNETLHTINSNGKDFVPLEGIQFFQHVRDSSKLSADLLIAAKVVRKVSSNSGDLLLLLDVANKVITFKFFDTDKDLSNFSIRWENNCVKASAEMSENGSEDDSRWCRMVLQPKLNKWATNAISPNTKVGQSLKLVDIEEYSSLYNSLKVKYGKHLVEIWPECTDAKKFVYEDIAIVTYLILLWKTTGRPKSFVDLGCGNGLLVFILNSEGFVGYGIDIRKRKIWDIYPPSITLLEKIIIPNELKTYENVDWILGNHSDELSPWIPLISALNSYETKYFLLPCCAYELNGEKFQRRNSKNSVYSDFLEYIEQLSEKCNFITRIDRLRIPSTKRIACIGVTRTYAECDFEAECIAVRALLRSELKDDHLKLRDKIEAVRNCTQIDKSIIDRIVLKIFSFLLSQQLDSINNNGIWRRGNIAKIHDIADHISSEELKNIKSECGGLKTLLKNKHEVFEVIRDDVKIRYPRTMAEYAQTKNTVRKRVCFFFSHHPDGCPLSESDCTFIHS